MPFKVSSSRYDLSYGAVEVSFENCFHTKESPPEPIGIVGELGKACNAFPDLVVVD